MTLGSCPPKLLSTPGGRGFSSLTHASQLFFSSPYLTTAFDEFYAQHGAKRITRPVDNVPKYGLYAEARPPRSGRKMRQGMTIGGPAQAAGGNVETIRYYQRRGAPPPPPKPPGGAPPPPPPRPRPNPLYPPGPPPGIPSRA